MSSDGAKLWTVSEHFDSPKSKCTVEMNGQWPTCAAHMTPGHSQPKTVSPSGE